MKSIRELYKVGPGPSSSHTIGPKKCAEHFKTHYPSDEVTVDLYGSLALTGKGHLTDYIIEKTFSPTKVTFVWHPLEELPGHPNGLTITSSTKKVSYLSVGGGTIKIIGEEDNTLPSKDVYEEKNFSEVIKYCEVNNMDLYDYVMSHEDKDFKEYLEYIWQVMQHSVELGLTLEGELSGGLHVKRRAKKLFEASNDSKQVFESANLRLSSYAISVAEVNASGEDIVTAPTCGASGVLPAVLYYLSRDFKISDELIIKGLAVAGIVGNVIKTNSSISGAEAGCQAEIGSATSMAAAAYAYIKGYNFNQIDTACEIALEHCLGLTCDPIDGLVQIPCIERNGVFASRAMQATDLAYIENTNRKITFDMSVRTMLQTGKDMSNAYRETSLGGLAKLYRSEC